MMITPVLVLTLSIGTSNGENVVACDVCQNWQGEDEFGHFFDPEAGGVLYSNPHSKMVFETLCANHNHNEPCGGGAAFSPRFDLNVLDSLQSKSSLAAILRHSDNVVLNTERRALQVTSCNGLVIAHYPVEDHVYLELAEELGIFTRGTGLRTGAP